MVNLINTRRLALTSAVARALAAVFAWSCSLMALPATAAPAPTLPPAAAADAALEVRVWTADEQELPSLEIEVTHQIQLDAHSVTAHQLLSHLMVRIFTRDPSDLYILRQAADLAQQAVGLEPKNPRGYAALADILDLMGNAERGLKLLDDAEAQGIAANWRFAFAKARLMTDRAPSAKILAELATALKLPRSEPRIIVPYVTALLQAEASGEDLVARLKKWDRDFPSPLFELTTAVTLTDLGSYREAHNLYKHILQTSPHEKEAQINDAIVLYRDLHDQAGGINLFQLVLAEHSGDLSSDTRSMINAHLGAALVQQKRWSEARSRFVAALATTPGNPSLIDFMAHTFNNAKQPAQLVQVITQLNDQVQGSGTLHALLGETLSEHLGRHEEAVHAFADALILDPERSDYYNGMGLALYRKKAFDSALKAFALATEVDPNDATARYNEACVLAVTGRSDEALNTLAEAISIDPRLMQTAKDDRDFAGLKTSFRFQNLVDSSKPAPEDDGKEIRSIAH